MPLPPVSYAQRFEDLYLMRCFGAQRDGFYIDVGSGHPVYDNTSFAFYLAGWHGITVEPNPRLAQLTRSVRQRDRHVEAAVGAAAGTTPFYLVDEYHGLSTTSAEHARAAQTQFGKASQAITVPVTTLAELCRTHAPATFEFLKVDVEGAEADVLRSGDWSRYRPKVIVVEALAAYTLAPAWDAWEPFLAERGYRYVWFDSLNRYYLAREAEALASQFETAPDSFQVPQFRNMQAALIDENHPDRRLAELVARAALMELPLLDRAVLLGLVTAGIPAARLAAPAAAADIAGAIERVFGPAAGPSPAQLRLPPAPRLHDVYAALVESEAFRIGCGRISASYAW